MCRKQITKFSSSILVSPILKNHIFITILNDLHIPLNISTILHIHPSQIYLNKQKTTLVNEISSVNYRQYQLITTPHKTSLVNVNNCVNYPYTQLITIPHNTTLVNVKICVNYPHTRLITIPNMTHLVAILVWSLLTKYIDSIT